MAFSYLIALSLHLYVSIALVNGDQTADYIYNKLDAINACFRRLNASHQIGCGSDRDGNVGIVHYIENNSDMDWLLNDGPDKPYAALMTPQMFTGDNVKELEDSGKVNSILLIRVNETDMPGNFSPDSTCPNNEYDLYTEDSQYSRCQSVQWNDLANSLMHEDHDIPFIVLTNGEEVKDLIHDCYEEHNAPRSNGDARNYPLCAVQVKVAMDGAADTETCIRRSTYVNNLQPQVYCDPLGDQSVFGFVKPGFRAQNENLTRGELIIASARLDSFSMFEDHYPSADSAATGIVTLLAVAEALGKVKADFTDDDRPIMLSFFHGEAFEYIGSARVLYDMLEGKFPYRSHRESHRDWALHRIIPENIGTYIELSQLGLSEENKLWMHTDPVSRAADPGIDAAVERLLTDLMTFAADSDLALDAVPGGADAQSLPPASTQTFLKDATSNFSAVVIADHKTAFSNKYYNSIYDLPANINASYPDTLNASERYDYVTDAARQLAKVANVTAQALYKLSRGVESADVTVNETVVANLLYCFLHEPQHCELIASVLEEDNAKNFRKSDASAFSYYVGVMGLNADYSRKWLSTIVHNILARYLGDDVPLSKSDCNKQNNRDYFFTYTYMQGGDGEGVCVNATVNYTIAKSPAFEDYDSYDWGSRRWSTWTESRWATDAIRARFFLVPPLHLEVTVLVVGLLMLLASLLLAYLLEERAHLLFPQPPNAAANNSLSRDSESTSSNDVALSGGIVNVNYPFEREELASHGAAASQGAASRGTGSGGATSQGLAVVDT